MRTQRRFSGPLFISGMPRSGTKLLRDLMNNHSQISIPDHESHCIPMMIRAHGLDIDLNHDAHLKTVLQTFQKTKFYHNYPHHAEAVTAEAITAAIHDRNWATVLEYIFRTFAVKEACHAYIWGDKTPGYLLHEELLRQIFPNAKFIHIIRDPRDYVLSVNHAWGKSMLRAAQRWRDFMHHIRKRPRKKEVYLEVFYEDLLDNPEKVLIDICIFSGINYETQMVILKKPSENLGHAKGQSKIVKDNKNKFLRHIPVKKLKRIEEVICVEAEKMRYEMIHPVAYKPITSRTLFCLKLYDALRSSRFHMKEKGVIKGYRYFVNFHRQGSWRRA